MKVLLIQPPLITRRDVSSCQLGDTTISPPWRLLCVYAYLRQRTRHEAQFVDCRVLDDWEAGLSAAAGQVEAGVAVVNVDTDSVGEGAAVLDGIKRLLPSWTTAICGSYPSQFPGPLADLGRADYALAGDPEPILRDLIEYFDLPRKLIHVPGLLARWMPPNRNPFWLQDLRDLSLPDVAEIPLTPYRDRDSKVRISVRLTRGHTQVPADRAFGDSAEPLRIWPMDRFATFLQRTTSQEIHEVFLADPPGVWTPERLNTWCQTLVRQRNTQSWSLRMLPTLFAEDTVELFQQSRCCRIEFLYPATSKEVLAQYGCVITPAELFSVIRQLESAGLWVSMRFWLGGPESDSREAERITRVLRQLGFPVTIFEPYPFLLDAPITEIFPEAHARRSAWQNWARDPWTNRCPERFWTQAEDPSYFSRTVTQICSTIRRDPKRILQRWCRRLRGRNWIAYWENRSAEFWNTANMLRDVDQRSK